MELGKKTNQTKLNIILIHLPIQDSLTIHWKPSTESCGRRSCARRDTVAHQCTLASVAQDRLIERDRRCIHTRRIIVDRRTIRKSESVQDPSRAAPSPIPAQDPVREIDQCGEDQKVVPIAHGEFEMKKTLNDNPTKTFSVIVARKMFKTKIGETSDIEVQLGN